MDFATFKAKNIFFEGLSGDMKEYAVSFAPLLQEQPAVYAAAALVELDSLLEAVYNPDDAPASSSAMQEVFNEWFRAHFTEERLVMMHSKGTIAQPYGFSLSTTVSFGSLADHALGLLDD